MRRFPLQPECKISPLSARLSKIPPHVSALPNHCETHAFNHSDEFYLQELLLWETHQPRAEPAFVMTALVRSCSQSQRRAHNVTDGK